MTKYSLPHFEELDTENLEEFYEVEVEHNDDVIEIDLNFENKKIDPARLDLVKQFIENISTFDKQNKKHIQADYADKDKDTIKSYVEYHLDELDKNDLRQVVDFSLKTINPRLQLVNALHLIRVGLYPDSEDQFAIFDYSIDRDLTDYLVVIFSNEKGEIDYMTMES